ncbi:hypothetical protein [Frankia sp. Cj5]|uniref:hypothetical protein n=1 Tax=Frankia sp. Cj5 TaxID=2880978 RepID=UPI001EF6D42F|nr:hypothetical protein [Frankia sp. Cj5]
MHREAEKAQVAVFYLGRRQRGEAPSGAVWRRQTLDELPAATTKSARLQACAPAPRRLFRRSVHTLPN